MSGCAFGSLDSFSTSLLDEAINVLCTYTLASVHMIAVH